MDTKEINEFDAISVAGSHNLLVQSSSDETAKVSVSALETYLGYYRSTEFVASSAGAGDAGKPIVLDGNGKIASSLLNPFTGTLAATLAAGNMTGSSDIIISTGQKIASAVDAPLTLEAGQGVSTASPGQSINLTASAGGTVSGDGGDVVVTPGEAPGSGEAGVLWVVGDIRVGDGWKVVSETASPLTLEAGPARRPYTDPGQDVAITASDGGSASGDGGSIVLTPGAAAGSGDAGVIQMAGDVLISWSKKITSTGSNPLTLEAGPASTIFNSGADVVITATDGGTNTGDGGNVILTSGASPGFGDDGAIRIAGNLLMEDGWKIVSEDGSDLTLKAGYAATTSSSGQHVLVTAGSSGKGSGDGGDIVLTPGVAQGVGGSDGAVQVDGTLHVFGDTLVEGDVRTGPGKRIVSSPSWPLVLVATDATTAFNGGSDLTLTAGDGGSSWGDGGNVVVTPGASPTGSAGVFRVVGDVDITGKLTVAGLIDPPGLILDAATAPSTGTTQGGIFVDSADHHLKYRAPEDGDITDLLAGGGGATTTSMARVDPLSSDAADDGDLSTAFATIQGAVNAVETLGKGQVLIAPGVYREEIFISADDVSISLVGDCGPYTASYWAPPYNWDGGAGVVIEGSIIITDCPNKVAARAYADTTAYNYGALVGESTGVGPYQVELKNLCVVYWDLNDALRVGSGDPSPWMLGNMLTVSDCWLANVGMLAPAYARFSRTYTHTFYSANCGLLDLDNCWIYIAEISGPTGGYPAPFQPVELTAYYTRFDHSLSIYDEVDGLELFEVGVFQSDLYLDDGSGATARTVTAKNCYWSDIHVGGSTIFVQENCYNESGA